MKSGDVIFLTKRTDGNKIRIFISFMIALLTGRKGQKLSEVKVHTATIYKHSSGVWKVRDMDKNGDDHYSVAFYFKKYAGRIEVRKNPYNSVSERIAEFNYDCENLRVKYDYKNTFLWQVLRKFTGKFSGKNTPYARMCAEDFQRLFNILVPGFFDTPEKTNPNEVYFMLKDWEKYVV